MQADAAETYITDELRIKLPQTLFYHGLHHVIDVTNAAMLLAESEAVKDRESLVLLRTAALFHDCGFLRTYQNHEEAGCVIATEILPLFGYSEGQIDVISGMIMATKIPQRPLNLLEEILCDADLDYLGRDDFEPIADTLFQELRIRDIVPDIQSWNKIQVKFLQSHQYWTHSARQSRALTKQQHLLHLLEKV